MISSLEIAGREVSALFSVTMTVNIID